MNIYSKWVKWKVNLLRNIKVKQIGDHDPGARDMFAQSRLRNVDNFENNRK